MRMFNILFVASWFPVRRAPCCGIRSAKLTSFFLKPVAVSAAAPYRLAATPSGSANCPWELALYSLTEHACSPFHAEPTQYQGGHAGLSVRVAKGVYYHVGGFNGRRIQTASLKRADQGAMLLTTQNLYFGGAHTNFRIPYERVLSCRSYTDGIGLFRDSANAKPEVFSVIEAGNAVNAHPITGWLLFNLVKFLAQPEGRALYTAKRQKQAHPARAINQ